MSKYGMYLGKRLEDMSRQELMEAIVHLGILYQKAISEHVRQLNVLDEFRKMK